MSARQGLIFLLLSAAVACTPVISTGAWVREAPTTARQTTQASPTHPHCGSISVASDAYGSHLGASSGHPGASVEVFGTTLRGEDGKFSPSKRLEVWWNTEIPDVQGADAQAVNPDSPILLLTIVHDMDRCRFRTRFIVPDVPAGRYRIRTIVYSEGGYGWFGYHHFTVT